MPWQRTVAGDPFRENPGRYREPPRGAEIPPLRTHSAGSVSICPTGQVRELPTVEFSRRSREPHAHLPPIRAVLSNRDKFVSRRSLDPPETERAAGLSQSP